MMPVFTKTGVKPTSAQYPPVSSACRPAPRMPRIVPPCDRGCGERAGGHSRAMLSMAEPQRVTTGRRNIQDHGVTWQG